MGKPIKMTPAIFEEIKSAFEQAIGLAKLSDGKFSFTKALTQGNAKALLTYTPKAFLKIKSLVAEFSSEVAWHGLAKRGDPEKNEYVIYDILVYPQEVSGDTVNTDQAAYEKWLMSQDDAVFNNIREQGHSHVDMGVTPSGVDIANKEKILEQLEDDMFYIFEIWNKKDARTIQIYDMLTNTLYEGSDVTVRVAEADYDSAAFMDEAKKLVAKKTYTYEYGYGAYENYRNGYSGNTGYSGSTFGGQAPVAVKGSEEKAQKKSYEVIECGSGKKEKTKKAKRKPETFRTGFCYEEDDIYMDD